MTTALRPGSVCPLPLDRPDTVQMAHGGGGTMMHRLIDEVFLSTFQGKDRPAAHDATVLTMGDRRFAFTTDSFVVHPLFFPGGDIGSLAVHGTVNDLAMSGARPLWLSVGFILEEGLPTEMLQRVVASMQAAASEAGVMIVTGDTKVVERGKGDGLYINTAGIGEIHHDLEIGPTAIESGDAILVNGDIGRHGIAVMAQREGLEFESTIESDSASVAGAVDHLISAGVEVHCLRDLTRGGLASALNEIATAAGQPIHLDECLIPVNHDVQAACEILGFDPLYVACEGRFIAFVPERDAKSALAAMEAGSPMARTRIIGSVRAAGRPVVQLKTHIGTARIVDMLSGEQLPRIC